MYSFPYDVNTPVIKDRRYHTEMKKIKAVALVLIVILCGEAFTRVMQVERGEC